MKKLKRSFFRRDTLKVAEELLGYVLVRRITPQIVLKGRIVETEAYLGTQDPSCHSFSGKKTKRTQVMYLPGGVNYVYFTYGMHFCFNIITAEAEEPEAVLIRALEPLEGVEHMKKQRNKSQLQELCNGPAKLCQAFSVDKSFNGKDLEGDTLYIENKKTFHGEAVQTHRVGLSLNSDAHYWPIRFYIPQNDFVSRKDIF